MGQTLPLFVYFRPFNIAMQLKKRKQCARDSSPGPQDEKRRRIHCATVAPLPAKNFETCFYKL